MVKAQEATVLKGAVENTGSGYFVLSQSCVQLNNSEFGTKYTAILIFLVEHGCN